VSIGIRSKNQLDSSTRLMKRPFVGSLLLAVGAVLIHSAGCGEAQKSVRTQAPKSVDRSLSPASSSDNSLGIIPAEPMNRQDDKKPAELTLPTPEVESPTQETVPPSPGYLSSIAKSVSQAYLAAKAKGQTAAGSAQDWLLDELNSDSRWEYKILAAVEKDPAKLESQLNELGRDGWQCFHVESADASLTLFMQRRPASIVRNIPMTDLLKVIPYLGFGSGDK